MKYTYEINSENKTIVVITTGDLKTKELASMGLTILLKAKELKYKIIFDHRLSRNRISITEAYYWFGTHYDSIDSKIKFIPSAYIANKEDMDFYSFFATTSNNKGIPIKIFLDEKPALEWLESY
jgi:hypothetical protein